LDKQDRTPEGRRRRLVDDIRRLAGLAESVVTAAERLGEQPPEDVTRCVDVWRTWQRRIAAGGDAP
jgi:hypothetical protein